jgi:hypothetical protein
MEQPVWPLWAIGVAAMISGVLLFIHRERATYLLRQYHPFFDSTKDSTGEGALLIIPAIFAPLIGLFFLAYAGSLTFGW